MRKGCGLNLKNVVRHVTGRNSSLRRMYATHGVPLEASTDSRGEKFAIAIAQCQWTQCVWRSNNSSIVIDVRGLGNKNRPTLSEMFWNGSPFQQRLVSIKKELRAQTTGHTCRHHMEFRQG